MALTTLDTVKADLSITGTGLDDTLTRYIAEASARIEGWCQQTLGFRTITQTERNPLDPIILEPDGALTGTISMTSVTVDGTTLDGAEYERDGAMLYRLRDDTRVCWSAEKVVVVYDAGYVLYPDGSANVPADLEGAAITLVRDAYFSGQTRDPYEKRVEYADGTAISYGTMGSSGQVLPTSGSGPLDRYKKWC